MNPDVFDDPYAFRPQRWIDNPRLDRAFIGFARGTRNCIG
jgi:cytochrome P450